MLIPKEKQVDDRDRIFSLSSTTAASCTPLVDNGEGINSVE